MNGSNGRFVLGPSSSAQHPIKHTPHKPEHTTQPDGFDETYAEMDNAVKNTISHRYRALAKLRDFLLTQHPADGEVKEKEA